MVRWRMEGETSKRDQVVGGGQTGITAVGGGRENADLAAAAGGGGGGGGRGGGGRRGEKKVRCRGGLSNGSK